MSLEVRQLNTAVLKAEEILWALFGDGQGYDGYIFVSAYKTSSSEHLRELLQNYRSENSRAQSIKNYMNMKIKLIEV